MYRLGVDIGGTKVNIGLLDEKGNVIFHRAEKLPESKDPASVLNRVKTAADDSFQTNGISRSEIVSCGIGVPGTVSGDMRTALKVPNLGWENAGLCEMFEGLTGIPSLLLQDSRAAAYGEYIAGRGRGKKILVCITLGTGLGTGIVMDGDIFAGALGNAGEMGHIPAVPDGRPCGCGKKGCVEKYAAGTGLDITARELYGPGHSAADIFEKAGLGDMEAKDVLGEAVRLLGNVMVCIINLISPDCLLFSGGMSEQKDLYVYPLIRYIEGHCYSVSAEDMPYMDLAALGADAPMIGAALYPAKKFGKGVK